MRSRSRARTPTFSRASTEKPVSLAARSRRIVTRSLPARGEEVFRDDDVPAGDQAAGSARGVEVARLPRGVGGEAREKALLHEEPLAIAHEEENGRS
jgi:hypothetical protein